MHGQGVSWQLPSPRHKVPAGWLGDVTMMLSQSWETLPDLVHSFPVKPHCEMPWSLNAWAASAHTPPTTEQQGHLPSTH